MIPDATKRQTTFSQAGLGRNGFRFTLLTLGLLVLMVLLFLIVRWWSISPPPLQPGDLLLLEPESIVRVEAAAQAGDILAQSTLGNAYLDGRGYLAANVTEAVYWLRKVAGRDRSDFDRIPRRMESLLEKRPQESDLRKRHAMDLEFLDLVSPSVARASCTMSNCFGSRRNFAI